MNFNLNSISSVFMIALNVIYFSEFSPTQTNPSAPFGRSLIMK